MESLRRNICPTVKKPFEVNVWKDYIVRRPQSQASRKAEAAKRAKVEEERQKEEEDEGRQASGSSKKRRSGASK